MNEDMEKLQIKLEESESKCQSLKEEIKYVQNLRQGEFSSDSIHSMDEAGEDADAEKQQRIEANPVEAANHYLRLH